LRGVQLLSSRALRKPVILVEEQHQQQKRYERDQIFIRDYFQGLRQVAELRKRIGFACKV
jgi:hypothetical protein